MSVPVRTKFPVSSKALRVFLVLCQLFGVSPIRLNDDDPKRIKQHVWLGRIIFVAHLCWCLAIIVLISFCMLVMYSEYVIVENAPIMQILNVSEYIFNFTNCVLIFIGANYQRRWQSIYFQQINALDVRLKYPVVEANADINRFLRRVFMVCGLFLICVLTIMIAFHKSNYLGLFLTLWSYVVTNLIISLALLQYLILIFLVQQRYMRLVSGLSELSLTETVNHIPTNAELLRNIFMVEMQTVGKRRRSPAKGFPDAIKRRIEVLRTCYVDLNILERNISQSFGVFLVSLVTSAFIILTTQLYVFYTLTQISVSFLNLAYSSAWLILHFVKIFALLFLSSRVAQEKLNVARTLHQLRFVGHNNEDDILDSIAQFSLQILHEDRNQMACGILKLDLTLLGTLVSSLTTYLVILIQFDSSSPKLGPDSCVAAAP